jgi:tetratricopeptide (TPR) repeat protein
VGMSLDEADRRQAGFYLRVLAEANSFIECGEDTRGLARFDEDRLQILHGYEWAAANAERTPAAAKLCAVYPYDGELVVYLRVPAWQRIEWCRASAAAASRIGDRGLQAAHLHKLSMAYLDIGELDAALPHEERALAINRDIGRPEYEASCLGGLGLLHAARGDHREAVGFYEKALAIYATIDAPWGEGVYWSNLGDSYTSLGEPRKATIVLERALRLNRAVKDRRTEGYSLGNLAKAHAALGDARSAVELFGQQLAIAEELEDSQSKGYALLGTSRAHAALGNRAEALMTAREALGALQAFGDPSAEECRSDIQRLEETVV